RWAMSAQGPSPSFRTRPASSASRQRACARATRTTSPSCGNPRIIQAHRDRRPEGSGVREGGRLAAAIEVLSEVDRTRRPLAEVLKDWGHAHRFAGSRDRTAIGNLAHDVLRRRASLAYRMGVDEPRALVL